LKPKFYFAIVWWRIETTFGYFGYQDTLPLMVE